MTRPLTLAQAETLWRASRTPDDPALWPDLERSEAFILDQPPTGLAVAALILEVILDQGGDPRSDGRDQAALRRVLDFLSAGARTAREAPRSTTIPQPGH